jgi:hypothetical protein
MAGLEDAPRAGRPCKLTPTQRAAFQARVSVSPETGKDSVGQWRAADVQPLIWRESTAQRLVSVSSRIARSTACPENIAQEGPYKTIIEVLQVLEPRTMQHQQKRDDFADR